MVFIMFPIERYSVWGLVANEAEPSELLPDVDPAANPAPAQAVNDDEIIDGGKWSLSTSACLRSL